MALKICQNYLDKLCIKVYFAWVCSGQSKGHSWIYPIIHFFLLTNALGVDEQGLVAVPKVFVVEQRWHVFRNVGPQMRKIHLIKAFLSFIQLFMLQILVDNGQVLEAYLGL